MDRKRFEPALRLILLAVPAALLLLALGYMVGMRQLEGQERTFLDSLQWAAETLTTTGYGRDAHWTHPLMVAFVILAQLAGTLLLFLLIPVALIPFLEDRFEARLPRSAGRIEGHVIVYGYGPPVVGLLDDLEAAGVPTVVVESDEARARRLFDRGQRVVMGRLEGGVLERVGLDKARALVGNGTDEENTELVVGARDAGFEGPVLALVEHPFHRKPLLLAGATSAITPRHALGAALAALASRKISPAVAGIQTLGGALSVRELRIGRQSPLAGKTLREAGLGKSTGATVIGQWVAGRLTPAGPSMTLRSRGILVVAGSQESLERMEDLCVGTVRVAREGHFVIAGFGEVGRKVHELLTDAGEPVRVVDRHGSTGVDVVGELLDPSVLQKVQLPSARCVILALDHDTTSMLATVVVRDAAPEATIIARVNHQPNVEKIHLAGADFALALGQVSGQILTGQLLGEQAISIDSHLKLLKAEGTSFADRRLAELQIREKTGCSVVAVERAGEVLVDLGADFQLRAGDVPYVCGNAEAIRTFRREFA